MDGSCCLDGRNSMNFCSLRDGLKKKMVRDSVAKRQRMVLPPEDEPGTPSYGGGGFR